MIELNKVSKIFSVKEKKNKIDKIALENISFKIEKGETIGLIGANGSGKSTLIKIIVSLYEPTKGDVLFNGSPLLSVPNQIKKEIGVLYGGDSGLYNRLTARENIVYFGELNGVPRELISKNIDLYQDLFDMKSFIDRRVSNFSRGMKQKVCFVRAIVHDPKLIILDEPSTGLDVQSIQAVAKFIKHNQKEGKTIIISSHNMDEIANLCSRVIILKEGKLVYFDSIKPLISNDENKYAKIYEKMGVDYE